MDSGFITTVVFVIVMLCWFVFAAAFIFRKKQPSTTEKKRDNTARYGIALEAVGYAIIWSFRRPTETPIVESGMPLEIVIALLTIGLALTSVRMLVQAVRALGKQWAVAARVVEGHKLITEGPYNIVRNPIYAGMFGMMIATGLAVSFWWTLPPAIILFWIGTMMRVRSEEKLLREAFGNEFEEYVQRVPALFPRLHF